MFNNSLQTDTGRYFKEQFFLFINKINSKLICLINLKIKKNLFNIELYVKHDKLILDPLINI